MTKQEIRDIVVSAKGSSIEKRFKNIASKLKEEHFGIENVSISQYELDLITAGYLLAENEKENKSPEEVKQEVKQDVRHDTRERKPDIIDSLLSMLGETPSAIEQFKKNTDTLKKGILPPFFPRTSDYE